MTVRLAHPSRSTEFRTEKQAPRATCALVNNMPDAAFEATERQYLGLLEEASGSTVLEVRRITLEGVPRGEPTAARIAEEYFGLSTLYLDPPDFLIVTGSNPIEARLHDEPYWADLAELITWSRRAVRSTLLSCLAAHAALTLFDDIERVRLPSKCTGVFVEQVEAHHPVTAGLEPVIDLPHSRWNTAPREALELAGYDVLIHSDATNWAVAVREEDGRQLLLVQGHPEYDPSSLLREYRRDAGRFVRREQDVLPCLPFHCVSPADWGPLTKLHETIVNESRDPDLVACYPFDEVGARAPWLWRSTAVRFYANWLANEVDSRE